eukprot:GHVT01043838.1.p1 GENE.GHVT01043838.1~~GHVT01043838.1.p1  ORF type:complete len:518 (+),score=65.02 GHVT01043838.1:536-2089(+)
MALAFSQPTPPWTSVITTAVTSSVGSGPANKNSTQDTDDELLDRWLTDEAFTDLQRPKTGTTTASWSVATPASDQGKTHSRKRGAPRARTDHAAPRYSDCDGPNTSGTLKRQKELGHYSGHRAAGSRRSPQHHLPTAQTISCMYTNEPRSDCDIADFDNCRPLSGSGSLRTNYTTSRHSGMHCGAALVDQSSVDLTPRECQRHGGTLSSENLCRGRKQQGYGGDLVESGDSESEANDGDVSSGSSSPSNATDDEWGTASFFRIAPPVGGVAPLSIVIGESDPRLLEADQVDDEDDVGARLTLSLRAVQEAHDAAGEFMMESAEQGEGPDTLKHKSFSISPPLDANTNPRSSETNRQKQTDPSSQRLARVDGSMRITDTTATPLPPALHEVQTQQPRSQEQPEEPAESDLPPIHPATQPLDAPENEMITEQSRDADGLTLTVELQFRETHSLAESVPVRQLPVDVIPEVEAAGGGCESSVTPPFMSTPEAFSRTAGMSNSTQQGTPDSEDKGAVGPIR